LHIATQSIAVKLPRLHDCRMGTERTRSSTPDLFSADAERDASAPTKLRANKPTTQSAPQRHILPKDLPNAVKHLSDRELDLLYATTLEEVKRRGRRPPGIEADLQTLRRRFDGRPDFKKNLPSTVKRPN
jgi:hypothetical protein